MSVTSIRHQSTVLITMENGPVNTLTASNGHVRSLIEALSQAEQDHSCKAIVIAGSDGFSAAEPMLPSLMQAEPRMTCANLLKQSMPARRL